MTGNPFGRFPSSLESHTQAEGLGRRRRATPAFLLFGALVLAALWPLGGQDAPAQPLPTYAVTVHAFECGPGDNPFPDPQCTAGDELQDFTFIINEDNTHYASDPPNQRPSIAPTESHSRMVAAGDQDHAVVNLPNGRVPHLDSVAGPQAVGQALHGQWRGPERRRQPAVHAAPARQRSASSSSTTTPGRTALPISKRAGLGGFHVTIEEQTDSLVSVNYFNEPLCGGDCTPTDDGFVESTDLGPATYFVYVTPPDGPCNSDPDSRWVQTTTIDGGFELQAGVEEGSDGTGAPGRELWEPPDRRTGYWFGFVCVAASISPTPGPVRSPARARNWQGWPPFDVAHLPAIRSRTRTSRSADSTTDRTVFVGQGDGDGQLRHPERPRRHIQHCRSGTSSSATSSGSCPCTVADGRPSR